MKQFDEYLKAERAIHKYFKFEGRRTYLTIVDYRHRFWKCEDGELITARTERGTESEWAKREELIPLEGKDPLYRRLKFTLTVIDQTDDAYNTCCVILDNKKEIKAL